MAENRGRSPLAAVADLRTGVKMGAVVTVLAAAALTVGIVAITSLGGVYTKGRLVATDSLQATIHLAAVRDLAQQSRVLARDVVIAVDLASTKAVEAKIRTTDQALDAAAQRYRAAAADPALFDRFTALWTQYRQIRDTKLLPAAEGNNYALAGIILNRQAAPFATQAFTELDAAGKAEQDEATGIVANARHTYEHARDAVIAILAVGLLVGLVLAWYITRLVLGPLGTVSAVLDRVAEGDLTATAALPGRDEFGRMGQALDRANARTREAVRAFSETAQTLAASAEELSATSGQIGSAAEQASDQAGMVSAAAEEVSTNIQTVAASSEQMTASISEIARNATDAAQVAAEAVGSAQSASTTMVQLGRSSEEVGNVIKVITAIAEQTNLLALNATIEAARAGEMGKGFAVVASEVKDLAQETAKATDEIGQRIVAIQNDITNAVGAIENISGVIARIDQFQTTIAAAVEEQTATTQEIGRNIAQAATGSSDIARNVNSMASTAQTTREGISQSRTATDQVAQMSTELQRLASQFRV
jgi:methyl-accepting chemotaxis protein